MPNYKVKLTRPLTDAQFNEGMRTGTFVKLPQHRAFIAFIHYTALRCSEALALKRSAFRIEENDLLVTVAFPKEQIKTVRVDGKRIRVKTGKIVYERFKHSKVTPALPLPLELPFMDDILATLKPLAPDSRVFPYCRKTGYNIVNRVFEYPHYHRLSRITWFLQNGFSIAEVLSWTGLNIMTLQAYVGMVSTAKMGRALTKARSNGANEAY